MTNTWQSNWPGCCCDSKCSHQAPWHLDSHCVCYTDIPLNSLLQRSQNHSCTRLAERTCHTDSLGCKLAHTGPYNVNQHYTSQSRSFTWVKCATNLSVDLVQHCTGLKWVTCMVLASTSQSSNWPNNFFQDYYYACFKNLRQAKVSMLFPMICDWWSCDVRIVPFERYQGWAYVTSRKTLCGW